MTHPILALSAAGLLAAIAIQNLLVPKLRNETISSGLTGPDHGLLDASYVPLSVSLAWVAHTGWMGLCAVAASLFLPLVAATNTGHAFFDRITGGKHALWHSRFTVAVFVSAFAMQLFANRGWLWAVTALTVALPAAAYLYFRKRPTVIDGVSIAASPAAEKLYVAGLCSWIIGWALR